MPKPRPKRSAWGLAQARAAAGAILAAPRSRQSVATLLRSCHATDPLVRQQAADTLRRLSEKSEGRALLQLHAEAQIDALSSALSEQDDWRTRSHLLLAAARAAHTPSQRQRAVHLALDQVSASENVVRACALESLGLLAKSEHALYETVEPLLLERLATGTPAERVRARDALRRLGTNAG